jgi:hypothetical protein
MNNKASSIAVALSANAMLPADLFPMPLIEAIIGIIINWLYGR